MCMKYIPYPYPTCAVYILFLWSIVFYSNKIEMDGIAQPILTCMLALWQFDHQLNLQLYNTVPRPKKGSLDIRELLLTLLDRRGEASAANCAKWFEWTWVYLNKTHQKLLYFAVPKSSKINTPNRFLDVFGVPSRFCTDTFQPPTVLLTLALLDQWPEALNKKPWRFTVNLRFHVS